VRDGGVTMAAAKPTAAAKAAVNAAAASETETPVTTGEVTENAAVDQAGPILDDSESDGLIAVVVLPRNTLRHDGKKHRQHAKVLLPADEVDRLVKRGVVVTLAQARADALEQEGVSVSVSGLVKISQV